MERRARGPVRGGRAIAWLVAMALLTAGFGGFAGRATAGAASGFEPEHYVALGDSYSSGTGTRSYYDDGCLRSEDAFARVIGRERPATSVTLAACSGATIADVESAQLAALDRGTDWVTITVGGNDAGFAEVLAACARPWWAAHCGYRIERARRYIAEVLPNALAGLYAEIRRRAPGAKVIAPSYPYLFAGSDCDPATFFSPSEMTELNETAEQLGRRIAEQVAAADSGFIFADAVPPFDGHAVCSADAWLNRLSLPAVESYHPNRLGHREGYAPLIRELMG